MSENLPPTPESGNFSGHELADSLAGKQPEATPTAPADKAEATRQELVNAGVEDKFGKIDLVQPDGKTAPVIGSSEYKVMRSDGRVEDGWQTYIIGDNIIMAKTEDGKEIHKQMSQKEWFVMQAKIEAAAKRSAPEPTTETAKHPPHTRELDPSRQAFEQKFDGLMAEVATRAARLDQFNVQELSTDRDRRVTEFGRVRISLWELTGSPKVAADLYGLRNHEKNGRNSEDVIYDLVETYQSGQYNEAEEQDAISVSLVRLENGQTSYILDGGRHRLAAAQIAGLTAIEVELKSRKGFLDDEIIDKFKDMQVHSPIADQRRNNISTYNSEADVI